MKEITDDDRIDVNHASINSRNHKNKKPYELFCLLIRDRPVLILPGRKQQLTLTFDQLDKRSR